MALKRVFNVTVDVLGGHGSHPIFDFANLGLLHPCFFSLSQDVHLEKKTIVSCLVWTIFCSPAG